MRRRANAPQALPVLRLKVRVHGRHPWFYRKMIQKPDPSPPAGSACLVRDRDGELVGTGFYNPRAELALRMFADAAVPDPGQHFTAALHAAVALREETLNDAKTGRAYRANLAVIHQQGSKQYTLWGHIDESPRDFVYKALQQRRAQMVGDAVQLSNDVDHWNDTHGTEEPIQIVFDFTEDVEESKNAPDEDDEQTA